MAGPVSYTPNPPPDLSWLPKPDVAAVGGKKKNNDAYNILAKPQIAITDALTGNWLFKLFG